MNSVATYAIGTPAAARITHMITSKAIGHGRNTPTSATNDSASSDCTGAARKSISGRKPIRNSHGISVIATAPSAPAKSISGTVVLNMYHRLRASALTVHQAAPPQVDGATSMPTASS